MNKIQYKTNKLSKKRVYYEGSDTLQKGYVLCYNYDTTTDMDGSTVAEGSQCNGKFLRVEKPSTNAAKFVAGIVPDAYAGFTGPGWIEIIELIPNQIVEVYHKANATKGSTYLEITDSQYYLSAAGSGTGVTLGLAMEDDNNSSTADTSLMKVTSGDAEIDALSDAIVSDEKVLSDAIADVSQALNSDESILSDAIADVSQAVISDETVLSDLLTGVSDGLAALDSLSAHTFNDAAVSDLASDMNHRWSDLVTALSNMTALISGAFS